MDDVAARLASFEAVHCIRREIREGGVQLLGTSGTVTTWPGWRWGCRGIAGRWWTAPC